MIEISLEGTATGAPAGTRFRDKYELTRRYETGTTPRRASGSRRRAIDVSVHSPERNTLAVPGRPPVLLSV